jgi:hypothetical protein
VTKLGALAAVPFVLAGCGAVPEPSVLPTPGLFQVELATSRLGPIVVTVTDHTGVVSGAELAHINDPATLGSGGAAFSDPANSRVQVSWLGGECTYGPTVAVDAVRGTMLFTIAPDAGMADPQACSDVGYFYSIYVNLVGAIPQQAVDVKVVR